MIKHLADYSFQTTEDGSFTLRLGSGDDTSEAMHSMRGAFSETNYIYGDAIRTALDRGWPLEILSMGLGLGYVELLAAALHLSHSVTTPLTGESFEIVPELRAHFAGWLGDAGCPKDFAKAYDDILARTAQLTNVNGAAIKSSLAKAVQDGNWKIREALEPSTAFSKRFTVICFDAFSSKSTPDLWTEEFLNSFFEKACAPGCALSTYACTGALKRSLRNQGFELTIREGFASKRDSTFALRG